MDIQSDSFSLFEYNGSSKSQYPDCEDSQDFKSEGSAPFGRISSFKQGIDTREDEKKGIPVEFDSPVSEPYCLSSDDLKDSKSGVEPFYSQRNTDHQMNQEHDIGKFLQIDESKPRQTSWSPEAPERRTKHLPRKASRIKRQSKKPQTKPRKAKGTKNVLKNFGRHIIRNMDEQKYIYVEYFKKMGKDYMEQLPKLTKFRQKTSTIVEMRNMWIDKEHGNLMRAISENYFRKRALQYIFNSHVQPEAFYHHICFRNKLREGLRDPRNFTHLQ